MTGRRYNPDEIRTVGGKVSGLSGGISKAGAGITGVSSEGAFGKLPNSAAISSALAKFTSGMRKEFSAGAKHATGAGESLTNAAARMDDDEDEGVRTFSGRQLG